jgi:BirA family transcriptional regulator, biotin operon repressor / biotin---[acetyl-CoA-carboxylase] ligase
MKSGTIESMNEQSLHDSLVGLRIPDIRFFHTISSTNDEALTWAQAGAKDGVLVVADTQTAGRGRLDRRWITQPGSALAFSLVIRPQAAEIDRLGLFPPLGALAVCTALEEEVDLQPEIKWPNDVLLNGRKLCGILLEASWLGDHLQALVVGIGVNVLNGSVPPPEELLFPATCLENELGGPVDLEQLLHGILKAFLGWRSRMVSEQFLQAWEKRLAFKGRQVSIENSGGQPITGVVAGINPSGDLRLQSTGGQEIYIAAGDVRLRPAD